MKILQELLPYHSKLEYRNPASLDLIVIHATELPSLALAREFGEKILYPETQTGNSGHYYIDRDGKVVQYVEDNRAARHVIGYNATSLGIEIVNSGRYPNWFHTDSQIPRELFTTEQINALKELLRFLKKKYPQIVKIARHSDLDLQEIPSTNNPSVLIRRKIDPGPVFPWDSIHEFWKHLSEMSEK
jgi:N-acetylmuramoyl-L-alanine amidase